jgi:pyridoxal/pyridoxine/pyridoxamine kinase
MNAYFTGRYRFRNDLISAGAERGRPSAEVTPCCSGDLLAALLLAHSSNTPKELASATERAVASLQQVLQRTAAAAGPHSNTLDRTCEAMRARELQLVQSQQDILNPRVQFRAVQVHQ